MTQTSTSRAGRSGAAPAERPSLGRPGWIPYVGVCIILLALLALALPSPAAGQGAPTPPPGVDAGGALRFEDTDPSILYGGAWTTVENPGASGGTVHRANVAGATAQLAFTGPKVTWVTSRGPNRGVARVVIDGQLVDTVDLYRSAEELQADIDFTGLGGGAHTIRIEVAGTRNGAATDALVDVDAFVVNAAPTTPVPSPTPTATATPTPTVAATSTPTATPAVATVVVTATPTVGVVPTAPPGVRDQRYFIQTSFRIDHDPFWDYFNARGGVGTFGFPISRTFTFLGCTTQFFQRQLMQQCPGTGVRTMNLLDPDLMPYSQINFSTFPAHDPNVAGAAPAPGTPNYGSAVLDHVRRVAPDTLEGRAVRFFTTFVSTVPGTDPQRDPDFAALVNLEVWGFPTSNPARDPSNGDFVYQRFQRGIMHFRANTGTTEGILLADYFKSIITARNLPPDLAAQAAASPYLAQYCPGAPGWVCRPAQLPDTDLTFAFETQ